MGGILLPGTLEPQKRRLGGAGGRRRGVQTIRRQGGAAPWAAGGCPLSAATEQRGEHGPVWALWGAGVFLARGQSRWKAPPCLAILLAVVRSGSFWFGAKMRRAHGWLTVLRGI